MYRNREYSFVVDIDSEDREHPIDLVMMNELDVVVECKMNQRFDLDSVIDRNRDSTRLFDKVLRSSLKLDKQTAMLVE